MMCAWKGPKEMSAARGFSICTCPPQGVYGSVLCQDFDPGQKRTGVPYNLIEAWGDLQENYNKNSIEKENVLLPSFIMNLPGAICRVGQAECSLDPG